MTDTTDKWVLRAWGMHYEYSPTHKEVWTIGWVTRTGAVTRSQRDAYLFASEAEAWEFAATNGTLLGHDEERGDWCWAEQATPKDK